ncbi:MAG: formimidoylglutamate deiminase [Gammaproteobacteria bacterium]
MTVRYFAKEAFLQEGWAKDVLITVDSAGWIIDIQSHQKCENAIDLCGPVLPGMSNVHSHAFQRAMAGLAERASGEKDSFWTWREVMYKFLEKLTPEDLQAIAAQLYVEMLKAGYTAVGEFHYVHHQMDGTPYEDRALTSRHVISAALETGIAITHLPVLYAYSGFGGQKPTEGQKRFINNETQILEIIAALKKTYQSNPQVTLGLAHHSLRAVSPEQLQQVTQAMDHAAPIHIHIAEQIKEVNDCIAWSGQRPVEWLLSHANIDQRWCLVHATHLSETETHALAKCGAIAGLCPTTEANLGDGLFNLREYLQQKGRFGIGSDSHISVNMIEELRLLEYGQRLAHQERAIVSSLQQPSVGTALYTLALAGGAQALGRPAAILAVGKRADFIALDAQDPVLFDKKDNLIFDAMIFACNNHPVRHVVAGGRHVVKDFRHEHEDKIVNLFKITINKINSI